jgi:ubiquinone/menaquinone biosynthesis C-methylase UbiE
MDLEKYWHTKHLHYAKMDWIDKPSVFSQFAVRYFPKQGKVLDLGAGQGCDSRFFAQQGYKVTWFDSSETALNLAKEKAHKAQINDIEFVRSDMSKKLPFDDNSFDIAYSNIAIHYFDEATTKNLFNEVYRVLKPEGILAYLVNSMSDPEVNSFKQIGKYLYLDPLGLQKRYFTIEYAREKAEGLFEIIILDQTGKIHDRNKPEHLLRFIGKKLEKNGKS